MKELANSNQPVNRETLDEIVTNPKVRRAVARGSHRWFFTIYFSGYLTYPSAPFHRDLFQLSEQEDIRLLAIMSFRGSAKSTILAQSFPIWAVVGKQQLKHVLILTQTIPQAKLHLKDIRGELERNALLKEDLGPFQEEDEWHSSSLVLPRYGAKITAALREQSIRGIKHGPYRPQLVILDDVEDLESTYSKESCDKTYAWFTGDVMPIGDKRTRIVLLGNRLGEDSLLPRVIGKIKDGSLHGAYRAVPLLDEKGNVAWTGKYPSWEEVENQRRMGDEVAWRREFLLQNIPRLGLVVQPEWIAYYDRLPPTDAGDSLYTVTSIDPASSLGADAAFTAIVSAQIHGYGEGLRVYILPNPVNERMEFPDIIERAKQVSFALGNGYPTDILVEEVQSQVYIAHELINQGLPASGIKIHGSDKRHRLMMTTHLIRSGKVLFPRKGAEELIEQIVHFGVERHDDLVDAFTMLILQVTAERRMAQPEVFVLKSRPLRLGRRSSFWDDDDE